MSMENKKQEETQEELFARGEKFKNEVNAMADSIQSELSAELVTIIVIKDGISAAGLSAEARRQALSVLLETMGALGTEVKKLILKDMLADLEDNDKDKNFNVSSKSVRGKCDCPACEMKRALEQGKASANDEQNPTTH